MADELQEKYSLYQKKKAEIEKQMKQISIPCAHKFPDKGGKSALVSKDSNVAVCRRCKEEFSMRTYNIKEILAAIEVLHNVINQIKTCCDPNNESDQKLITSLGELDYHNLDIAEVYQRVMNDYGNGNKKKKKKKKNNGSNIGHYGNVTY